MLWGVFKCATKLQALNPNDFKFDKGTKRLLWENICPVITHEHTSKVSLQELRHPRMLQKGPRSQAKLTEQLDCTCGATGQDVLTWVESVLF